MGARLRSANGADASGIERSNGQQAGDAGDYGAKALKLFSPRPSDDSRTHTHSCNGGVSWWSQARRYSVILSTSHQRDSVTRAPLRSCESPLSLSGKGGRDHEKPEALFTLGTFGTFGDCPGSIESIESAHELGRDSDKSVRLATLPVAGDRMATCFAQRTLAPTYAARPNQAGWKQERTP